MKIATALLAVALFSANTFAASASERAGGNAAMSNGTINKMKPAPVEDDDESFFSNGNGNDHLSFVAPRQKTIAAVDVNAVCRDVLADDTARYDRRFVEGCRTTLSQRTYGRASR